MNLLVIFIPSNIPGRGLIFEAPDRLAQPNDVYRVTSDFYTFGGERYLEGDTLEIIERTEEAPFDLKCSSGNLLVKGKDGNVTVWSGIDALISDGTLKLVMPS
jgi:hypothetical protein